MELDFYKIEVIHYLDPHLIWIVVRDPSVVKDEFLFEQIGLYGLLPLEKPLAIRTDVLKVLKSEEWLARGRMAAAAVIKDLLEKSDEVWFSPMFIDRRTSIFDDNIHKYGEIIFKSKNGKFHKLSKLLIKFGFAYNNVCEFNEKLSNGQLKTKLTTSKTEEVIRNLENYCLELKDKPNSKWKKSVQEQTSVFHMYKAFELSLTEPNKHNNEIIKEILKRKYEDFELCKDVDEQSLGRACSRMKNPPESDKQKPVSLSVYIRPSNLSKIENLKQTNNGVVKFLAANSNVEDLNQTNGSQSTSKNNTRSEIDAVSAISISAKKVQFEEKIRSGNQFEEKIRSGNLETKSGNLYEANKRSGNHWIWEEEDGKIWESGKEKSGSAQQKEENKSVNHIEEKTNYDKFKEEKVHTHKTPRRSGKPTNNRSPYRFAFGPPGMNPKSFFVQEI